MLGAEYSTTDLDGAWESLKTGVYWQQTSREFHRETAFFSNGSPGFAGPPLFVDPTSTVTTSVVDTDDEVNTYEWQTQVRRAFGEDHKTTFGFDLGYDDTNLPETETQAVVAIAGVGPVVGSSSSVDRVRADANQTRFGLYAEDTWTIGDFDVIPGIRGDFFNIDNNNSDFNDDEFGLSGSVGGVYHLSKQESYYVSLASGFRVPDLGERFQNGIVNLGAPTRIIGKEDLDSERAWSAEVGTKRRAGKFTYEAAAYVNEIENYIGTRPLGMIDGFVTDQYDNLGDVTLYGGEAAITYAVTDQIDLYANAARTWTQDADKLDVTNWTFNYGVKHTQSVNNEWIDSVVAGFNLRTVLESEDLTPSAGKQTFDAGSFTVVDLFANVNLSENKAGKATLVAGVRNLFDRTYQEPFFPMNQPERSGYVGVQFTF